MLQVQPYNSKKINKQKTSNTHQVQIEQVTDLTRLTALFPEVPGSPLTSSGNTPIRRQSVVSHSKS